MLDFSSSWYLKIKHFHWNLGIFKIKTKIRTYFFQLKVLWFFWGTLSLEGNPKAGGTVIYNLERWWNYFYAPSKIEIIVEFSFNPSIF